METANKQIKYVLLKFNGFTVKIHNYNYYNIANNVVRHVDSFVE